MKTICFTDNEEVIETKTARDMDEAIAKIRRMVGGFDANAERVLRAGDEIVIDDCETVFIR